MKKSNLFLVLMMALIVMSCSKDETTMSIPQESNAIEFGTYVGRDAQTRAPVLNNAVFKTDGIYKDVGFGILAYYTAQKKWENVDSDENSNARATATPNFMWNQQVKYATDKWTYNPIKYWPTTQNDKVSFFAYAPFNGKTTDTSSTSNYGIVLSDNAVKDNPTITFTLQSSPSNMVDLVTAHKLDMGNQAPTAPTVVDFSFKHALSRVNFIAKASELLNNGTAANKTIINITDVKLDAITGGQFYNSGKYTLSSTADKGVWSEQNSFTTTGGYNIADILANTTPVVHGEYSKNGVILEGTSDVNLFTGSQYLFLIPPATALTASGAKVTFSYDIVTIDDNLSPKYSKTTATKTVALPAGTLQQGVAYNYTFTFNVDQVEVTATVADWGTITNIPSEDDKLDVDYTHDN